jgi:hypothetical protein
MRNESTLKKPKCVTKVHKKPKCVTKYTLVIISSAFSQPDFSKAKPDSGASTRVSAHQFLPSL